MEQATSLKPYATYPDGYAHNEAHSSGVSWSAVVAGAFVTAALSLILLALGAGLGLSSVSPFSNVGASASTLGATAIVWLIVMEIISSSMGGYLAGRLRTKWSTIHSDEVYFRDTAHGFLAWSTALVVTAAFLATAATVMVGSNGTSAIESKGGSSAQSEGVGPNTYFVDTMFRTDATKLDAVGSSVRNEAGVIFSNALRQRSLPPADKTYLDQLVSSKTGMTQSDADKRVSDVFASAQEAAEKARKAVAHSLLWIFLALLIGAFCASLSATIGGGQRDRVVIV
ncbi:MAG: hypothetical protein M3O31_01440 [Acidobacteriota bacterium]|nr:hypothetical protein [Acidobacteriota bacterium]